METKGLTCKIPLDLHRRISEEIWETESTVSKFIEMIIREHYQKGETKIMAKGRTLAFQVSEELFQRIKAYLEWYEQENHRRLTQREFVIGLIEQALEDAEEEFSGDGAGDEMGPEQDGLPACPPTCDGETAGDGTLPEGSEESDPGGFGTPCESPEPGQYPEECE